MYKLLNLKIKSNFRDKIQIKIYFFQLVVIEIITKNVIQNKL